MFLMSDEVLRGWRLSIISFTLMAVWPLEYVHDAIDDELASRGLQLGIMEF